MPSLTGQKLLDVCLEVSLLDLLSNPYPRFGKSLDSLVICNALFVLMYFVQLAVEGIESC